MTPKQIEALLAMLEPQIRAAFIEAVNDMRSSAQLMVIAQLLNEGKVEDAVRMAVFPAEFWAPFDETLRIAYFSGARNTLLALPQIPDPTGPGKS